VRAEACGEGRLAQQLFLPEYDSLSMSMGTFLFHYWVPYYTHARAHSSTGRAPAPPRARPRLRTISYSKTPAMTAAAKVITRSVASSSSGDGTFRMAPSRALPL
jgi:hypothetical protein